MYCYLLISSDHIYCWANVNGTTGNCTYPQFLLPLLNVIVTCLCNNTRGSNLLCGMLVAKYGSGQVSIAVFSPCRELHLCLLVQAKRFITVVCAHLVSCAINPIQR